MLVESQELLIDSVTDKVTQESAVEVLVALDSMLSTIRDMRNAIAREYGYSSIRPAKTDQTNEIVDVLMNGGFQVDALNSLPIDFSEVAARHGEGLGLAKVWSWLLTDRGIDCETCWLTWLERTRRTFLRGCERSR
jgi:hypothetical protein